MAQAPLTRCPRCKQLKRGACKGCSNKQQAQYDKTRPTAHQRGYGRRWQRASKQHLQDNPLCVACFERGRIKAAECVDHIVPHRGDMELFWRRDLWQSLCTACHAAKTRRGE